MVDLKELYSVLERMVGAARGSGRASDPKLVLELNELVFVPLYDALRASGVEQGVLYGFDVCRNACVSAAVPSGWSYGQARALVEERFARIARLGDGLVVDASGGAVVLEGLYGLLRDKVLAAERGDVEESQTLHVLFSQKLVAAQKAGLPWGTFYEYAHCSEACFYAVAPGEAWGPREVHMGNARQRFARIREPE